MGTNWVDIESELKKKAQQKVDRMMSGAETNPIVPSIKDAGEKMVDVITSEMSSSGLTSGQMGAIPEFICGSPVKLGICKYAVVVNNGEMMSPSLVPSRYDSIEDLTLLFNDGVDHIMNRVYGYWHGNYVGSKTCIPATHFLENAQNHFMSKYGNKYHITMCELNK